MSEIISNRIKASGKSYWKKALQTTGGLYGVTFADDDYDCTYDVSDTLLTGVTVNLRDPNNGDAIVATTVSDNTTAQYSFSDIDAGTYNAEIVGWGGCNGQYTTVTITAGQDTQKDLGGRLS